MILDMNDSTLQPAEVFAFADWPYTPPARNNVIEQVVLKGSVSAGVTAYGRGTADQLEQQRPFPGQT